MIAGADANGRRERRVGRTVAAPRRPVGASALEWWLEPPRDRFEPFELAVIREEEAMRPASPLVGPGSLRLPSCHRGRLQRPRSTHRLGLGFKTRGSFNRAPMGRTLEVLLRPDA